MFPVGRNGFIPVDGLLLLVRDSCLHGLTLALEHLKRIPFQPIVPECTEAFRGRIMSRFFNGDNTPIITLSKVFGGRTISK